MKKLVALLLAAVLCFSLAACGNSEELEKYRKYETLINYIEAEDYKGALGELIKISEQSGNANNAEVETTEKTINIVEITMDNWQEYFEIRPYEETYYNDFGDRTGHNAGYGLYLKEEYLSKLANAGPKLPDGSVDVSFKVGTTVELREFDNDTYTFVEDGRIYSTIEDEVVVKVFDQRNQMDDDNHTSSGDGQVIGKMCAYNAAVDGSVYFTGVITENIDVRDVTGTLAFEE